ncbi:RNA 3'-terminal phosphate cyclase [Copidosoma floridanum]|uniref:RNA 3'-terminal phosphate cyclase n=1 Tax=Copidosoma floridanum TaxID=29053 RepID=UPI0006C9C0EF|nr:RNA 3'-terminal phosphate cyclase [Copidosoma floridanum]XP_014204836.1 RNA 3'-terminal phosphate cyclase [Copidosoma floridanum]
MSVSSEKLVKLDGSLGEGGGQVLRVALCLSALYRIPVEIDNIRAGRPRPGLSAQHLKGVELVKEMCNAEVIGARIGSTRLIFKPGYLQSQKQEFVADTRTAGCICLLIQIALPCALFSSRAATYILKGGTNVPFGPQVEYIKNVFKPLLKRFGGDFEMDILKRGYYPQGGGEVHMKVTPVRYLKSIELLDAGVPTDIKGWSYVAGSVNINEAQTMTNNAHSTVVDELSKRSICVPPIDIITYKEPRNATVGHEAGINLMCKTSKDCVFGGSGLNSETRAQTPSGIDAAYQLLAPILMDSCVDQHLQDQMVILMVLAKGTSRVKIGKMELTCHAETAKQVAELMLGDKGLSFSLNKDENGSHILECNGLGLCNEYLS